MYCYGCGYGVVTITITATITIPITFFFIGISIVEIKVRIHLHRTHWLRGISRMYIFMCLYICMPMCTMCMSVYVHVSFILMARMYMLLQRVCSIAYSFVDILDICNPYHIPRYHIYFCRLAGVEGNALSSSLYNTYTNALYKHR